MHRETVEFLINLQQFWLTIDYFSIGHFLMNGVWKYK
jgi:hypothetical protein